jgi:hypothetical protein
MLKTAVRKRVASVAVAALAATGAAAIAAPSASAFTDLSTLYVTATDHAFTVSGPHNIQAGLVKIVFKNAKAGSDITAGLVSFKGGWSFSTYRDALGKFNSEQNDPKKALAVLHQVLAHTNFRGGVDAVGGQTASMVVRLAPGSYTLYRGGGEASAPHGFTVFGSPIARSHPNPTATVVAEQTNRFGGNAVLPASGTIRFVNHSNYTPHMVFLQHVKAGTTRQEVLQAITGQSHSNPILRGTIGTDIVSPGESMTLTYHMPKGTYAEMCFFPDPKTGMPHAFMGMIRIVTLK